jgi:EpsI family protein
MQDFTSQAPGRALDAAAADGVVRRRLPFAAVVGVPVAMAFLAVYAGTIAKLIEYWSANDMYSYGFLVPVISGYLIWLRRDHLRNLRPTPSFGLGLGVLGAGLFTLIAGRVSATNVVEELSLPVSVWGVSLLVLGGALTRRLTFPLAYLFTMIPLWDVFTGRLHEPFQLYSAAIGVGALRALDIPVFHNGIFIELPNITLEVAQVCSGVNNLVAVLCIGVPLTHYYVSRWSQRLSIIASAALIALLSNGVRVAGVCLFAYYDIRGADGDVHGPYSLLRSLFISGVGFLTLFWLISYFADRDETRAVGASLEAAAKGASARAQAVSLAIVLAMLAAAGTFERWRPITPVRLATGLVGFPTTVGRWVLRPDASLAGGLNVLDFDAKLVRGYAAPDGAEVNLLVGYFASQVQGRELAGDQLLARAGFAGFGSAATYRTAHGSLKELVAHRGRERFYITYTYLVDGDVVPDDVGAKLRTTWNVVAHGRSNAGMVVIVAPLQAGESVGTARGRVRDFVDAAVLHSAAYLADRP